MEFGVCKIIKVHPTHLPLPSWVDIFQRVVHTAVHVDEAEGVEVLVAGEASAIKRIICDKQSYHSLIYTILLFISRLSAFPSSASMLMARQVQLSFLDNLQKIMDHIHPELFCR